MISAAYTDILDNYNPTYVCDKCPIIAPKIEYIINYQNINTITYKDRVVASYSIV